MKKSIGAIACAAVLAVGCALGVTACSGKQVAATVNGTEILEETITADVEAFRTSYGLTDADSWGEWMSTYGYTPETVRETMIDSYVETELIKAAAKENSVTVDSSEIDEYVNQMKAYYDSDEAWNEALEGAGFTEETYRERIEESLLEQALMDKVTPLTDPSDDTTLTYAKMYSSYYDGAKRSSHILIKTSDSVTEDQAKEKAQEILDKINSGEISFEDAAKQYSEDTASAVDGGDVGWDVTSSFVDEYQDALDGLEKDQISGLVTSTYGVHIIKCTDVYTAPETFESLDQMPSSLLDTIKETAKTYEQQTNFSNWLDDYESNATIVINDMPSGLSYYVDMSAYDTTNTSNTNSSNTNSNSNSNSNTNSNSNSNSNANSNGN